MKIHHLYSIIAITVLAVNPASAQSSKEKESSPTKIEQLRQIGTFGARTPVGTDLAKKPAGAQLAQPVSKPKKRRSYLSRQRPVVRPQ